MRIDSAITKLQQLKESGIEAAVGSEYQQALPSWRANVREVVTRSLGSDHPLLEQIEDAWRPSAVWTKLTAA